jgi:hypothetical protein
MTMRLIILVFEGVRMACRRRILLLLSLLVFHPTAPTQTTGPVPNERIYVGFLDDYREEMVNWKAGVAHSRIVRPAFERNGDAWREVVSSTMPHRTKWMIAFDSKTLGELESEIDANGAADDSVRLTPSQTILTPAISIPIVGKPTQDFAGTLAIGPTTARRPLVIISKPYFKDPDGWKRPTKLSAEIAELVRKQFRIDFPHVDRCGQNEDVLEHDWRFPDSALNLPVAYSSNKHSFLVETQLNAGVCGYVDDPDDPLSDPWFFVSSDSKIRRIGSFMSVLDAGDYDNDGSWEVVFFLSQPEDADGFVMFYRDFQRSVRLVWSYH